MQPAADDSSTLVSASPIPVASDIVVQTAWEDHGTFQWELQRSRQDLIARL